MIQYAADGQAIVHMDRGRRIFNAELTDKEINLKYRLIIFAAAKLSLAGNAAFAFIAGKRILVPSRAQVRSRACRIGGKVQSI